MLMLARRARGHFVTLIEIRVHLIRVKPGHISSFHQSSVSRNKDVRSGMEPGTSGTKAAP